MFAVLVDLGAEFVDLIHALIHLYVVDHVQNYFHVRSVNLYGLDYRLLYYLYIFCTND